MKKKWLNEQKPLEIPVSTEYFAKVDEYIRKNINIYEVSREISSDSRKIVNALIKNMVEQGFTEENVLSMRIIRSFGEIKIRLDFAGKAYDPTISDNAVLPEEDKILKAYEENIDYRYSSGHNTIYVIVKRSYNLSLMRCFGSIVLAILTYLFMRPFVSVETMANLEEDIVYPLVKMFSNAILMVGGPVTLFSLLKNLSDTYLASERNSSVRRLQAKTFITSAISIFLAIVSYAIVYYFLNKYIGYLSEYPKLEGTVFVSDVVNSLIPSSIVEPFVTLNPFPMILAALLVTYSLCSVGKYFAFFKKIIDAGYALFSRMMNIVMYGMPVFCYFAFLTPMLAGGFEDLILVVELVILINSTVLIIGLYYLARLYVGGVKIGPFLKGLPALIRENLRINSAVDAVPFNVRYCSKTYGYDRNRLTQNLRILAQINLDGNCCMLMTDALILLLGVSVPWYQMAVIIFLVFFLSMGAPNQPGTILIGTLIIIYFLKADDLISMAIYLEVFLGSSQNLVNVLGDIVTVAIEEQQYLKKNPQMERLVSD